MIGIRYTALRTQGVVEEGQQGETAVLDYPIHQDKLLKLLAAAYAWHFQAAYVLHLNDSLDEGLEAGDLSILKDVHGTMAGKPTHPPTYPPTHPPTYLFPTPLLFLHYSSSFEPPLPSPSAHPPIAHSSSF